MSVSVLLLLLLLPAANALAGQSYERFYGETIRIWIRSGAHSLKFDPLTYSESVILWKLNDPPVSVDSRRQVIDGYLVIKNITHQDSGNYRLLGRNDKHLYEYRITIEARNMNFHLMGGELLNFTFPLRRNKCNIYFLPEEADYGLSKADTEVVRNGIVMSNDYCYGYSFTKPCGLAMKMVKPCAGVFEVRDQYDGIALRVQVDWAGGAADWTRIGTGIGISFASVFFCCCVKRCCCRKKSKKRDADPAEAGPAEGYAEYDHEPVAPRQAQVCPPPEMLYPAQPAYAPTSPQIHNPPPPPPPAYSQVSAPAELSYTPSFPPPSNTELQFELKGLDISSGPPLSSESTYDSVFTSNKLNFL